MDANPHNQPTYADPPHQGVVIEDYRGPLLSQPVSKEASYSRTWSSSPQQRIYASMPRHYIRNEVEVWAAWSIICFILALTILILEDVITSHLGIYDPELQWWLLLMLLPAAFASVGFFNGIRSIVRFRHAWRPSWALCVGTFGALINGLSLLYVAVTPFLLIN